MATVNGVANVLMDGVITNNQISPGDKGSNSTLTITGKDLTVLMAQSNWTGFPFPAAPAEGHIASSGVPSAAVSHWSEAR